jgi:hypothetical protein
VYQISPHLRGLDNPELEGKGASTYFRNQKLAEEMAIAKPLYRDDVAEF